MLKTHKLILICLSLFPFSVNSNEWTWGPCYLQYLQPCTDSAIEFFLFRFELGIERVFAGINTPSIRLVEIRKKKNNIRRSKVLKIIRIQFSKYFTTVAILEKNRKKPRGRNIHFFKKGANIGWQFDFIFFKIKLFKSGFFLWLLIK
jgi:hypothetical protein